MKIIYIILCIILVVSFFTSCRTDRLSKEDLKWQPYKEGDSLIFESNKNELKTIVVESIESHINPTDPLDVFPEKYETLFVTGKDVPVGIIKINAGKEEGGRIYFELDNLSENTLWHPNTIYSIGEIKKMKTEYLSNKEVYKIEAIQSSDNLKDIPFDLRYIYWSKEYGYVKFEYENDYEWELKSLIRDGIDIWKY